MVVKSAVIKMAFYRAITDVLLALPEKSLACFMKAFFLYKTTLNKLILNRLKISSERVCAISLILRLVLRRL